MHQSTLFPSFNDKQGNRKGIVVERRVKPQSKIEHILHILFHPYLSIIPTHNRSLSISGLPVIGLQGSSRLWYNLLGSAYQVIHTPYPSPTCKSYLSFLPVSNFCLTVLPLPPYSFLEIVVGLR